MTDNNRTTRRSFLDILLGIGAVAWLGSVFFPILRYLKVPPQAETTPTSVIAAKVSQMKAGQGLVFRFGNNPALLIRTTDGNFKALSAVCTHLECTVQYRTDLGKIWCACHNGMYDLNGQNIAGPPPRPLAEFKVDVKGDDVIVSKA